MEENLDFYRWPLTHKILRVVKVVKKTVNMTGLGLQSDKFLLVKVFLAIWSVFDQFWQGDFLGSQKLVFFVTSLLKG